MASKKLSSDTSLANSYKLSRGVASVARPSAPTIGTATDGGYGAMSVTFTASTLGPTATSYTLTSSSGITGSGASSPLTLAETAVGTYTYSVSGVNANGTGPSSAASNSVNVASVFAPSGAYDSIATASPSGSTSLTFSSIPSTYTHLQIRYMGVSAYPLISSNLGTGTKGHYLYGTGASAASYAFDPLAGGMYVAIDGNSGNVSGGIIDILDYANTSKNKTFRALHGRETNTSDSSILFASGFWNSTSAISSITITNNVSGGVAFGAGTSFALYGIKGN